MSNPLFDMFGGQNSRPFGNMTAMMKQFNEFRQTFNGDPKQAVMKLLSSGQMSQDQYNQLTQMADQFRRMMK